MLLDALIKIKGIDDSLSMRMSCMGSVCGSDAMNINGKEWFSLCNKVKRFKTSNYFKTNAGITNHKGLSG